MVTWSIQKFPNEIKCFLFFFLSRNTSLYPFYKSINHSINKSINHSIQTLVHFSFLYNNKKQTILPDWNIQKIIYLQDAAFIRNCFRLNYAI